VTAWESARKEVTEETRSDFDDYHHYRYLPSERFGLFARCVAEKRIPLAKRFGRSWADQSRPMGNERLDRILQCLSDGGFEETQREAPEVLCIPDAGAFPGHGIELPEAESARNSVTALQNRPPLVDGVLFQALGDELKGVVHRVRAMEYANVARVDHAVVNQGIEVYDLVPVTGAE
jgi:hypothetical protein